MLRKLLRRLTLDRSNNRDPPPLQEIRTVDQIGPKRSLTPEGFLLCQEVPIARVGIMVYGPGETPIQVGPDGLAYVTRTADDLFHPDTIASFVGKPVVDEHPPDDVTPANWTKLARGVTFNVRPGSGEDADVLLADLLITDARMIRDIDAMKREVSAGYEADYEQTGDGQGAQTNIIGNHIALVERGRCGPRCAIGDSDSISQRKRNMPQVSKPAARRTKISKATLDALMEELGQGEEGAETLDDGELSGPADSHTHIHIHGIGGSAPKAQGAGPADANDEAPDPNAAAGAGGADKYEARFAALENGHKEILAQIAKLTQAIGGGETADADPDADGDEDDKKKTDDEGNPFAKKDDDEGDKSKAKTGDSVALETSYKETLAGCEVLVPGFRMPTFDSKAKRAQTIDTMCQARRKALDAFAVTADGAGVLEAVSGTKGVTTLGMACPQVAVLFRAAVGAKRLINNGNATRDAGSMGNRVDPTKEAKKGPTSLAELNALHRKHYQH